MNLYEPIDNSTDRLDEIGAHDDSVESGRKNSSIEQSD